MRVGVQWLQQVSSALIAMSFFVHIVDSAAKKSLICVTPALYTRDIIFCLKDFFLKKFFISMPQNVTVSARVALTLDKQKEENWKKGDWKRWNKWINNPLRCFIKKKPTTTAKQILMFAGGYNPVCYFYPGASCGLMFSFSSAVAAIMAGAPHSVLPLNLM